MTPMRPKAAKPTPAKLAILTASLTCNREGGESGSVSECGNRLFTLLMSPHMPPSLPGAKLESLQMLAGAMGRRGLVRKGTDRTSWPGIDMDSKW